MNQEESVKKRGSLSAHVRLAHEVTRARVAELERELYLERHRLILLELLEQAVNPEALSAWVVDPQAIEAITDKLNAL